MSCHRSLVRRDHMQTRAKRFPNIGGRRLSAEIEHAHLEENVGAALANKIRVRITGRSVVKMIQVGVALPGTEEFF